MKTKQEDFLDAHRVDPLAWISEYDYYYDHDLSILTHCWCSLILDLIEKKIKRDLFDREVKFVLNKISEIPIAFNSFKDIDSKKSNEIIEETADNVIKELQDKIKSVNKLSTTYEKELWELFLNDKKCDKCNGELKLATFHNKPFRYCDKFEYTPGNIEYEEKEKMKVTMDISKIAMNASLPQEPEHYINCEYHGLTNAWMQINEDIFCVECIAHILKKQLKTHKFLKDNELINNKKVNYFEKSNHKIKEINETTYAFEIIGKPEGKK